MDVSTHPVHDAIPGQTEQPGAVAEGEPSGRHAGAGRAQRGLRTVGFHVVALACFTVPAIVLWWHVWSGHPSSALTCGCGDPAQALHSKIHGITAVVASPFRGRVPTLIAQPPTCRCLNCSNKACPSVALGA